MKRFRKWLALACATVLLTTAIAFLFMKALYKTDTSFSLEKGVKIGAVRACSGLKNFKPNKVGETWTYHEGGKLPGEPPNSFQSANLIVLSFVRTIMAESWATSQANGKYYSSNYEWREQV